MNLSPTPNRYKSSRQPGLGNTYNNNNNNGGPLFNSDKNYADKLYTGERRVQERAPFTTNNENDIAVLPQPYIDNGNVLRSLKRENTELRLAVAEKSAELDQMAVLVESFRKKLEKYKTANGALQRELDSEKELNTTQRDLVQDLQQENTTLKQQQQHREPQRPAATTTRRESRRHTREDIEEDIEDSSDEEYALPLNNNNNNNNSSKKTQFALPKRTRTGHRGSLSSSSSPLAESPTSNELQIQNLNLKLDNLMAYIRDGNSNNRIPTEQQPTVTLQSHFDSKPRYVPQDEDIMVQESMELKALEEKIENMKRKLIIKKQNELRKISLNQEMLELMEKLDPSTSSTTYTPTPTHSHSHSHAHTHSQVRPEKTRVFSENSMECQTCTSSLKNTPDKKKNNNNNNTTKTTKPYSTNNHVFQNTLQNNPTLAELSDLKTDVKYYVDDDERSGVW